MDLFLDRIVIGLEQGAIYGSVALALVLIYRATGFVNFAQGEMALFSTFVTWQLWDWGVPIGLAIPLSMAVSFLGGALIDLVIIRPIGDAEHNPLSLVIATVGLLLALNALVGWIWGTDGRRFPKIFGSGTLDIGSVTISYQALGTLAVLVGEVFLLYLLFQHTRLGLAMRSVASNQESSRLAGIRTGRVLLFGWGLAAAVGALAGALYASELSLLDSNIFFQLLIYAFAAATLGGFDSPVGAVVGGLVVGLVTVLAGGYIGWLGEDLKLVAAFAVILVVLLVRPQGLFGRKQVSRV
jgi:branched-chain amino acid transport system permease protein